MKAKLKFVIATVLSFVAVVSKAQTIKSAEGHFELAKTNEVILQENIQFFNYSGGMALTDSVILVSTYNPPVVITYNMNGEQTGLISEQGRGPHEFVMPTIISNKANRFVVWDAVQLKFTEVSADGEPVNEYIGIKQAIGKFSFTDDRLLVYNKGHMDGPLLSIFRVNGTRLEKMRDIDSMNEDHKKLTRYGDTAPFAVKDEAIYYGRANETRLYKYDLSTEERSETKFTDKNFRVEKTTFSMNDRADKADEDWINFIYTNSRFKNIYTLDKYLVVEVQNGNNFDQSRETVLHIFDYDLKKLDRIRLGHNIMLSIGDGAKLAKGNELIFYKDYPDMTNQSGKYERGQEYSEIGEHHLRKLTFLRLVENKN